MSISIKAKTDYSSLFSSLSTSSSSDATTNLSWLSDYNSIKSGAYGKLMKAYYSENSSDEVSELAESKTSTSSITADSEETSSYNKVAAEAGSLESSISTLGDLQEDASESEIYSAANSFVKDYNALLTAAGNVDNSSISSNITSIKNYTTANKSTLEKIGIEIGTDGKLSLDKDKLAEADVSDITSAFADRSSYGYSVSVSAGMAQSNANYAATRTSTYTSSGTYSSVTGTLWDSTT